MKKTLKVFTVNHRHGRQGSLARSGASQSRKPLGSALGMDDVIGTESCARTLASPRDGLLPKLMRGEVRVGEVEFKEALRSPGDEARAQAYRRHLRPNDRYRRR